MVAPPSWSSVPSALSAATLALVALACAPPSPAGSASKDEAAKPAAPAAAPAQVAGTKKPDPTVPDPPWFSPAIFPGATVTKKGRSPADDQGRFTAQILFSLPDGATIADCTDPIVKAVGDNVPALDREEKDGRVTLKGAGNDYEVIAVCGEAKGKMTAFVSYRWLTPTRQ